MELSLLTFVCGHTNSSLVITLLLVNIKRLENPENLVMLHHKNNTIKTVANIWFSVLAVSQSVCS